MRPRLLLLPSLLFAACSVEGQPRPPPVNRFIQPSGIVHRDVSGSTHGFLYVASANFDRCYDQGSVIAVDLDRVGPASAGLPRFGELPSSGAAQIPELNASAGSQVLIQSFSGDLAVWERAPASGPARLFVPSRAEGDYLHVIDIDPASPTRLVCAGTESRNCMDSAVSLSSVPGAVKDVPRAPSPFGVTVAPSGSGAELWVTHLDPADSPLNSRLEYRSYLVRLDAADPRASSADFFAVTSTELPLGGTHSVVLGSRYAFFSGRFAAGVTSSLSSRRFLLRAIDRTNPARLLDPGLDIAYGALDARGLALSRDEARLFLVARSPDTLLVVDVVGATTDTPRLSVVGAIPLPDGASQVTLVPRPGGRSELVAISCGTAGVVALYDPDLGQLVAQVSNVGSQPYGMAVDLAPGGNANGARLFVTNFGDGRVAIIDIPDVNRPQEARLVAHLGSRQDQSDTSSVCVEAAP